MLCDSDVEAAEAFRSTYRTVRDAEGWGCDDPAYYRALPYADRSGRHSDIWRIRAKSFEVFSSRILAPLEASGPLAIADLGAGNGWLANRLTQRGHAVAAVDLDDDPRDGLGAHRHYRPHADRPGAPPFPAVQGSFDRLPWGSSTFDLVLFDGTLHYSRDYEATLREALRVLRPTGSIAVLDSPFYRDTETGEAMVRERSRGFQVRHGVESERNEAFLTPARLRELGAALGIRWRTSRPWYGARWALRPWVNRLRGRRQPARFYVVAGVRT